MAGIVRHSSPMNTAVRSPSVECAASSSCSFTMMNIELSKSDGSGAVHEGAASLPVRSTLHVGRSWAANVEFFTFSSTVPLLPGESDESDEQLPTANANMLNTKYCNFILLSFLNHGLLGFYGFFHHWQSV